MEVKIIDKGILGWINKSLTKLSPDAALIYKKETKKTLTARERLNKRKEKKN